MEMTGFNPPGTEPDGVIVLGGSAVTLTLGPRNIWLDGFFPVENERFDPFDMVASPMLVVIDPFGLLVVPYVIRLGVVVPVVSGAGVGVVPGFTVDAVGTVPSAINTLPVLLPPVECA